MLKNLDYIDHFYIYKYTGFYIKKENIKLRDDDLITIKESIHEGFYCVYINLELLERYIKLYKITKSKKLEHLFQYIDYLKLIKKYTMQDIFENILSEELAKSIDKEIIKNLINLK
jgi:cobalamin-dependent methionine synthase I